MTALHVEWNVSPRQSQWRRYGCCLAERCDWLTTGPRGVRTEPRDWLTAGWRGGIISAATVKIGKELALLRAGKRNKRRKTENTYPGRKRGVRWKRSGRWSLFVRQQPESDVFESVKRKKKEKAQHLQRLGRKCRCVNHRWAPGHALYSEQLGQLRVCEPAINKEWKHSNEVSAVLCFSCVFFFFSSIAAVHVSPTECLSASPPCPRCCFCLVCGLFVGSKCSVCLCLNLEGQLSQLVISGGRHGVHLAERHAGGCAFPSASFVRPRWLI